MNTKRLYCIVALCLVTYAFLYPAQQANSRSALQNLPPELIQNIVLQLSDTIGSPSVMNEKDINVVARNIVRLARTDKRLYTILNSQTTTNRLLQALIQRFPIAPITIAAQLHTPGTKYWLKKYIHTSGEYELYCLVRKIYALFEQVLDKANTYGVTYQRTKKTKFPQPRFNRYQTKTGLFFSADEFHYALLTPWGEIEMIPRNNITKGTYLASLAITQEFLKHFDWRFYNIVGMEFDRRRFEQLMHPAASTVIGTNEARNLLVPLTQEEFTAQQGTQAIISSALCGDESQYKLLAIDHARLPAPQFLPRWEYRSTKALEMVWQIMEDECNQDMQKSVATEHEQETNLAASASKISNLISDAKITKIDQIPAICITSVQLLAEQPIYPDSLEFKTKEVMGKVLPLPWKECLLCVRMTSMANQLFDESHRWQIRQISQHSGFYSKGQLIEQGIMSWWDATGKTPCSLKELCAAYDQVIKMLKHGWIATTLQENPYILHTQSEEDWYLFIKNNNGNYAERDLIEIIAQQTGLDHTIYTNNSWKNPERNRGEDYLWIRKDALDAFQQVFDFDLKPHPTWAMGNRFRQSTRAK